ncbi:hypothetical protein D3C73_1561830 [compost metagenome]
MRNVNFVSKICDSHVPSASGIPARLSRKLNTPAFAITNMITAVDTTDLCSVTDSCLKLRRR